LQEEHQTQSTKRYGHYMAIIAWVLIFALMVYLFGMHEKKEQNPNENPDSTSTQTLNEVILKANRNNHYVVTGKINNMRVVFLLDTGATNVSVPEHVANKLGLKKGFPLAVTTANGVVQVYSTTLKSLQVGSIVLKKIRANINPHMKNNEILLGMSALKHLELRHKEGELLLIQRLKR